MSSRSRFGFDMRVLITAILTVVLTLSAVILIPPKAEAFDGYWGRRVLVCHERADGTVVPRYVSRWQAFLHAQHGDPDPQTFYLDRDRDGFTPVDARTRLRCAPNSWWIPQSALADCNDWKAHVSPGATEILGNGIDDDCDPNTPDAGNPNQAPVITQPADQTNNTGDTINIAITANDPDADTLTYTATNLPPGTALTGNTITGTPTTAGTYQPTITVTDGQLSDQTTFTWTVNQPPPVADAGADSDCDGVLTIADPLRILQFVIQTAPGEAACPLVNPAALNTADADVNGDGGVNTIDALQLLQCTAYITNVACPAPQPPVPSTDGTLTTVTVPAGGTASVPVTINAGATSLGGVSVAITYDPAAVTVSCSAISGTVCNASNSGVIYASWMSSGGTTGTFDIATIEFAPVAGAASSAVDVDVTSIVDVTGMELGFTVGGGAVSV